MEGARTLTLSEMMQAMAAAGAPMEAIIIAVQALEEKEAEIRQRDHLSAQKKAKDAERKRIERAASKDCPRTVEGHGEDVVSPNDIISNPLPLSPSANADAPLSDFADRVMEDWNREIAGSPLPPITRMTPARRKALAARVREHGEEAVFVAIRAMAASDFHSGRDGKWTEGDFSWLMKPDRFVKMLERGDRAKPAAPAAKPSVAGGSLFARLQAGEITQAEFEAERARLSRSGQPPPTHRERPQSGSIGNFIPDIRGTA